MEHEQKYFDYNELQTLKNKLNEIEKEKEIMSSKLKQLEVRFFWLCYFLFYL